MRKQFIKQNGWWEESERRFWKKKINTDFNVHNSLNHHLNTRTDHLCSYATHIHQQQCMDANTMNRFLSPLYHIFFLFLSLAMSLVCLVYVCMQNPSVHQTFFGECCKANPNCDQIFKSEKRHWKWKFSAWKH